MACEGAQGAEFLQENGRCGENLRLLEKSALADLPR
jgi:hypothetical protein